MSWLVLLGYWLAAVFSIAHSFYTQPSPVVFALSPTNVLSCDTCGPLRLHCAVLKQTTAANLPNPVINWTFNNSQLPSTASETWTNLSHVWSTLTLQQPAAGDSGLYQCTARDGTDSEFCAPENLPCVTMVTLSNSAVVEIIGDTGDMDTVSIPACSPLVLGTRVHSTELTSGLTWLQNGAVIVTNEDLTILPNGDLVLGPRGNTELVGVYTAVLSLPGENGQIINSSIANYIVQTNGLQTSSADPTVQVLSPKTTYFVSEPISLVCTHNQGTFGFCSTPQWKFNDAALPDQDSVLLIKSATVESTGTYCCTLDEVVRDCRRIYVLSEPESPEIETTFVKNSSDMELVSQLPGVPLVWFYNGVRLQAANNSAIVVNGADLGVYQSFIEPGDQAIIISLTRLLPYGLTNPPGMPSYTQLVRAAEAQLLWIKLTWTPPLYTGGLTELRYRVSREFQPIEAITSLTSIESTIYIHTFYFYEVTVVDFNETDVSEVARSENFRVLQSMVMCGHEEVLYPPLLDLSCDGGLVNISLANNPNNTRRNSLANYHIRGSCTSQQEEVMVIHTVPDGGDLVINQLSNGTWCELEAAATTGDPTDCSIDSCTCSEVIEYSQYRYCTVTGTVRVGFNQSSFTVNEAEGILRACVVMETSENISSVVVRVQAVPDSATDNDFGSISSELLLSEGTSCVSVPVFRDGIVESNEQFTLQLWSHDPILLVTSGLATVTIIDSDVVSVKLSGPSHVSPNNQSVEFSVCVNLSSPTERDVVFTLTTTYTSYTDTIKVVIKPGFSSVCLNQTLFVVNIAEVINITITTNDTDVIISNGNIEIALQGQSVNTTFIGALVAGVLTAAVTFLAIVTLAYGVSRCYHKRRGKLSFAEINAKKFQYEIPEEDETSQLHIDPISSTQSSEVESDQDSVLDEYHSDSERTTCISIQTLDRSPVLPRNSIISQNLIALTSEFLQTIPDKEMTHHTSDSGVSNDSNSNYIHWDENSGTLLSNSTNSTQLHTFNSSSKS